MGLFLLFLRLLFPFQDSLPQVFVKLIGLDFNTFPRTSPIIKSHQDHRGAIKTKSETQGDVSGVGREIWVGGIQLPSQRRSAYTSGSLAVFGSLSNEGKDPDYRIVSRPST